MVVEAYLKVQSWIESVFLGLANHRTWLLRGVLLAIALSLAISFPRISYFTGNDEQIVPIWPFIKAQSAAPLTMHLDALGGDQASHLAKRAFRLTLPLIMGGLHLGWQGMLALQAVLGVLMLYAVGRLAMELFGSPVIALASVFGIAFIPAGKAAFLQLGGMGDAFAFAFLTFAVVSRSNLVIFACILAACFTDERGLVAAPLVGLYWAYRGEQEVRFLNGKSLAVLAAVIVAILLRVYLQFFHGLHVPTGTAADLGPALIGRMLPSLPSTFLHALGGMWLWPLIGLLLFVRYRQWLALVVSCGAMLALCAGSVMVIDTDRTLAYMLPLVYIGMAVAARYQLPLAEAKATAIGALIISFLFPANNLFSGDSRYWPGNILPVELVRFYRHASL